jgi:transposase
MVTFGVDAHKRTHTIVAVDDHGKPLGQTTIGTTSKDHLGLVRWAARFGADRRWAVEDCRHLSRRLERDLLGTGEEIVRVPPKLMALCGTPPAPTASPIPSTLSPWPALRNARPTCR